MKQTFTGRGGWEKDGPTENWGMYLIQKPVSGGPITKTSVASTQLLYIDHGRILFF